MYKDQTSKHHELFIIGGGAAGLMAAVTARDQGIDTAIIESNDRLGKKIITTGNGRCNITNQSTANLRMKRPLYHASITVIRKDSQYMYCGNSVSAKRSNFSPHSGFLL